MNQIPAFYFDPDQLARIADQYRESFRTAKPFQHVVLEGLVPDEIMKTVAREFPKPDDIDWTYWGPGRSETRRDHHSDKLGTSDETKFGPLTRHLMGQFISATFLKFLESLTGVTGLVPDPSFNRCGLHSTGPGGKLMVHIDDNRYPIADRLHQYLNLIVYLNEDWLEEYGGHLELWNRDATKMEKKILPVFNRAVLFNTGRYSWHGHPNPVTCPPDRRRNSLALYYYVLDRPIDENYEGIQRYDWVPTTENDRAYQRRMMIKHRLRKFVPPIFYELGPYLQRRFGAGKQ